jgi:hypothetical protein
VFAVALVARQAPFLLSSFRVTNGHPLVQARVVGRFTVAADTSSGRSGALIA